MSTIGNVATFGTPIAGAYLGYKLLKRHRVAGAIVGAIVGFMATPTVVGVVAPAAGTGDAGRLPGPGPYPEMRWYPRSFDRRQGGPRDF
jgi:hypothetical protein